MGDPLVVAAVAVLAGLLVRRYWLLLVVLVMWAAWLLVDPIGWREGLEQPLEVVVALSAAMILGPAELAAAIGILIGQLIRPPPLPAKRGSGTRYKQGPPRSWQWLGPPVRLRRARDEPRLHGDDDDIRQSARPLP